MSGPTLTVPAEAATTLVRAEHLSKWYGQVNGLNDVTASIPRGSRDCLGQTAPASRRS
jgi:hypothetical protein